MSWNEYVLTLREIERYQKQVRSGHVEDRDTYLNGGSQDPGSAYPNKPKGARSKSAPPAGAAMGEEVEAESFDIKETLEPSIWPRDTLDPDVSRRLKDIVDDFIENLDIEVDIEDIRFTGSLANYNWSNYSDIDLHIIVDFTRFKSPRDIVKGFFDAKKALWNDLHNIKIHGYEVEIYVEDLNEAHLSSGVYSIKDNNWVAEPVQREEKVDVGTARKKSDNIITIVNLIDRYMSENNYKKAIRSIDNLKNKIRRMRMAGLKSPRREYSPENIAFKILRREKILAKINKMKQKAYDEEMSLNGISRNQ
jgi:hypothetical protein